VRNRGLWRGLDDHEPGSLEWIDLWNHRRLLEPTGDILPAEAKTAYYGQGEAVTGAATHGTESPETRDGSRSCGGSDFGLPLSQPLETCLKPEPIAPRRTATSQQFPARRIHHSDLVVG
jgi:hypothetical protein